MKQKARLSAIRRTRLPVRKLQLALDNIPGTQWDFLIERSQLALRWEQSQSECTRVIGKRELEHFGHFLAVSIARAIKTGNANLFRGLADAIETWRNHKPEKILDPLCLHLIDFCMRNDPGPFQLRDIIEHLSSRGV
jgi:hypothetical protein